eukprot:5240843-Pyramimonas_sp.AAC.1
MSTRTCIARTNFRGESNSSVVKWLDKGLMTVPNPAGWVFFARMPSSGQTLFGHRAGPLAGVYCAEVRICCCV